MKGAKRDLGFGHVEGADLPWREQEVAIVGLLTATVEKHSGAGKEWVWNIISDDRINPLAEGSANSRAQAKLRASVAVERWLRAYQRRMAAFEAKRTRNLLWNGKVSR